MNPIKQVVMLHYAVPPVVGGVEFMIEPLCSLFTKNGWHVSLIAGKGNISRPNIQTTLLPELNPEHPVIQRLQENLKTGSFPENYETEVLNFEKKLMTHIGNIKNIIIHNMMTMPFNFTATHALYNYIKKNPHKNFFVWVHDLAYLMDDHRKYLFDQIPWTILKTAQKNVNYITISRFRKKQALELMGLPSNKIQIIPNGIDIFDFLQIHEPTKLFLKKTGLKILSRLLLVPARILPRKNLLRNLTILAELLGYSPGITMIITGFSNLGDTLSQEYFSQLKEQARKLNLKSENLIFLEDFRQELNLNEKDNREIVQDLYRLCKAVMLLSNDEGFGIPLLEAGITHKPLILSDLPVFHEVAGHEAIFISEVEPADEAAKTIYQHLFKGSETQSLMFEKVIQHYSWDVIWENYLSALFV
ncbi:MAG: glycosyltransferase [Candidatus Marinimicrobia bacterium]|nr:glycosyltransferase [Candidatus Neomarinimicrobiota bacterium]